MSNIKLTRVETPLAWPAGIPLSDIKTCGSCGIKVMAPNPGSLQIQSRRPGSGSGSGFGDGVTIDESKNIGADYRGQRYTLDEAIFHSQGLHIFPGQKAVYPAEYHIHFSTGINVEPKRAVTLVIPVDHNIEGPERPYFAAMKAKPDPTAVRPTLESLLAKLDGPMLQYQGPDIRGRVKNGGAPEKKEVERQFLLVLKVASIRASDLERIPSIDGAYTDPRKLPAPGVEPKIKALSRDRIALTTVLAIPGLLYNTPTAVLKEKANVGNELEIKPIKVVDGRVTVDMSGTPVDIKALLGLSEEQSKGGSQGGIGDPTFIIMLVINILAIFIGFFLGIQLSDMFWGWFFKGEQVKQWEPLKIYFLPSIFLTAVYFANTILI